MTVSSEGLEKPNISVIRYPAATGEISPLLSFTRHWNEWHLDSINLTMWKSVHAALARCWATTNCQKGFNPFWHWCDKSLELYWMEKTFFGAWLILVESSTIYHKCSLYNSCALYRSVCMFTLCNRHPASAQSPSKSTYQRPLHKNFHLLLREIILRRSTSWCTKARPHGEMEWLNLIPFNHYHVLIASIKYWLECMLH